jgi:hypothetical protein
MLGCVAAVRAALRLATAAWRCSAAQQHTQMLLATADAAAKL